MADKEFEEFSDLLDELPQHFKAADQTYKLVHAITPLEENKSFLEKVKLGEKLCGITPSESLLSTSSWSSTTAGGTEEVTAKKSAENLQNRTSPTKNVGEFSEDDVETADSDDTDEELLLSTSTSAHAIKWPDNRMPPSKHQPPKAKLMPSFTRKSLEFHNCPEAEASPIIKRRTKGKQQARQAQLEQQRKSPFTSGKSLQQELVEAEKKENFSLSLSTIETEDVDTGDVDSGNSTSHSPAEDKNSLMLTTSSYTAATEADTAMSGSFCVDIEKPVELLDPTHRGLHRFIPRHPDEIEIDIGDPVYVQKEAEDLWCEGANLRTGDEGIFPLAHVVDVDYSDFDPVTGGQRDDKKERYLLDYLGSVETSLYKGNIVLCQAIRKISLQGETLCQPPRCTVLEISDKGIKMLDKSKSNIPEGPDYFFNLKNVTFCGFHPREPRFFGFVTKHPQKIKYACHVFLGQRSTQHVAEACGRAFQRFYQKFMETAYPVEDIYLE